MTALRSSGCFFLSLSVAVGLMMPALPQSSQAATDADLAKVTDFASLQALAAKLAKEPYQVPAHQLDPFFEGLKYDGHRKIRFIGEKALYEENGKNKDVFRVEFFHPGWMYKKPVGFFDMNAGKTEPVIFDPKMFDYADLKVPEGTKNPPGYAGFRVLAPDSLTGKRFEFMVFMGASYYRAVTTDLGYGLSARGVAVNTIGGKPEEFPDFTHFWFQHPKTGDKLFRVMALLNGPSVTGAYEFETVPGKSTEMFVKATLHLRKPVEMLGLAPFSSMFWYGENSHPKPYDFRPEVHDSDGLQIEIKNGPSIWRALDVGKDMRLSVMEVDQLAGFGLAERDRDFNNFQDLEAHYHRRPSAWVEPVRGFDKGAVVLVELSTGEETWDNIVAMWKPAKLPTTPEEQLNFEYRLSWLDEHQPNLLCKVLSTRRGFVMDSDDHLYVIDFAPGAASPSRGPDWVPDIDVKITGDAKLVSKQVMHQKETGGWRAFFKLDIPPATPLLEMTCELKDKDKVISERWMYQWRR